MCSGELCLPPQFDAMAMAKCDKEQDGKCEMPKSCEYQDIEYKHGEYVQVGCKR